MFWCLHYVPVPVDGGDTDPDVPREPSVRGREWAHKVWAGGTPCKKPFHPTNIDGILRRENKSQMKEARGGRGLPDGPTIAERTYDP
jgi:hypothetical protein